MSKRKDRSQRVVSATELAEMGLCEMRVVLNHRHGRRTTPAQREAMARGTAAHAAYLAQGKAESADLRKFVVTCVFGLDAPETQMLRTWSIQVLQPRWWGRGVVASYHRVGPSLCRVLDRSPAALAVACWCLRLLVFICKTSRPRGRMS
jgi:hypothetical protein